MTTEAESVDDRAKMAVGAKQSAKSSSISKSWWNFWLDVVLATVFVALCAVSAVVQFVFPVPSSAMGWSVWNASLDQWLSLQFGILCVLAAGVILHVMLHWSWVCGMLSRGRKESALRTDDGIRTIVGVGFMIVLLHVIGIFVLAAFLSVVAP